MHNLREEIDSFDQFRRNIRVLNYSYKKSRSSKISRVKIPQFCNELQYCTLMQPVAKIVMHFIKSVPKKSSN